MQCTFPLICFLSNASSGCCFPQNVQAQGVLYPVMCFVHVFFSHFRFALGRENWPVCFSCVSWLLSMVLHVLFFLPFWHKYYLVYDSSVYTHCRRCSYHILHGYFRSSNNMLVIFAVICQLYLLFVIISYICNNMTVIFTIIC